MKANPIALTDAELTGILRQAKLRGLPCPIRTARWPYTNRKNVQQGKRFGASPRMW